MEQLLKPRLQLRLGETQHTLRDVRVVARLLADDEDVAGVGDHPRRARAAALLRAAQAPQAVLEVVALQRELLSPRVALR
ncbi:hypothetical protein DQ04_23131000 [Trypanosoma grayi]|uniref:hypothetical protein n=1 Tax=Trypanosoma grayi TaxID=71804 RepID=UPI0004F42BE5|nr:hypothetical protein DQ04_23131000 [Trypanosoma grayi]KEG05349.1 hypothetical protein DQ04_23131000 [Trypanosoma grayi]